MADLDLIEHPTLTAVRIHEILNITGDRIKQRLDELSLELTSSR
jgi:hypothetical protein